MDLGGGCASLHSQPAALRQASAFRHPAPPASPAFVCSLAVGAAAQHSAPFLQLRSRLPSQVIRFRIRSCVAQ